MPSNRHRQRTLLLASGSPRRRELLERVGVRVEAFAVDVDETVRAEENGRRAVLRLAGDKAHRAFTLRPRRDVLAADTLVVCDGVLLGKPAQPRQARQMLRRLSNRWHEVWTGVVMITRHGECLQEVARTRVRFSELTAAEIRRYADSDEPYDKAGGYAIQGVASWFVAEIRGSVTNVIGLPLECVRDLFEQAHWPLPHLGSHGRKKTD